MQLRHLRYFVHIVDAGSFSRAATTLHIAQPALSQQIAALELKLGVHLLLRSARGVRATPAGEILYAEAVSILRQVEQLPALVRAPGVATGAVAIGMASTLAASLASPFIETCRQELPKIILRVTTIDSISLKSRIDAGTLDLAIVFEDEVDGGYSRTALFRQRLFYFAKEGRQVAKTIALENLADLPLIVPTRPNVTRAVLDRAFAAAGLVPNVVMEGDQQSTMVSAVRQNIGGAVFPKGDPFAGEGEEIVSPVIIEPPIYLSASLIWSHEKPLTVAGEAVKTVLSTFLRNSIDARLMSGIEPSPKA